jgi:predicted nucleotidyltransferase
VFGSTLYGDDTEGSDLDLLIDPGQGLGLLAGVATSESWGESGFPWCP